MFSRCASCYTVYSQQVPSERNNKKFYQQGMARKYWLNEIWRTSRDVRQNKVDYPFLDWVESFVGLSSIKNKSIAEVAPVSPGLYEAARSRNYDIKVVGNLIHEEFSAEALPSNDVEDYEAKRTYDILLLNHSLDRSTDVNGLLRWCFDHLSEQGLCFITGQTSSGLDALFLDQDFNALIPPDRINCFSIEGFQKVAESHGFSVEELSTPGALDLQNLRALKKKGEFSSPFFDYLWDVRSDDGLEERFIELLQFNRLSSYMRTVLSKKYV